MVPAPPSTPPGARPSRLRPTRQGLSWKAWLLLGFCFGLGYGVTHRLLGIDLGAGSLGNKLFEVKPFPGTSLDALRQRFGASGQGIRGDLDQLEQERLKQEEEKQATKRQTDLEEQERQRQEQQQRQEERVRLEELQQPEALPPPRSEPEQAIESPPLSPPAPVPPPPPVPEAPPAPQP